MSVPASSIRQGATWGAIAGLVLAQLLIRRHSALGIFAGDVFVVFAVFIAIGAAMGAGIARFKPGGG